MNIEEIQYRIKAINEISHDDEAAHSLEDRLYEDFIKHVSKRKDKIGNMARQILATQEIDFSRWCA